MQAVQLRAMRFVLFGAVVVASLTMATPSSATSLKPYSIVICALGTSETCAPNPTSALNQPAAVPAGAAGVSMTATFTNENKLGSGINLGSANLTPPSGFTVASASVKDVPLESCTPSTPSTSSCIGGNVVKLRDLGARPGATVTVRMTVNGPLSGCTVASPCAWSVSGKQSSDFSGSPPDNLNINTSTSTLSTVLAHLQFGTQPHNAIVGQVIRSHDYATGSAVTVNATDATGAVVSSYDGVVSLTLNTPDNPNTNPNPSTLGGTTSAHASDGMASFADLTVSNAGNGYTLTASSKDLPPSTTSHSFDAQQAGTQCASNKACHVEAKTAFPADGGVAATVTAPAGPRAELAESIDFGIHMPASQCEGYNAAHDVFWNLTLTHARTKQVSITTTVLSGQVSGSMIEGQDNCLGVPLAFGDFTEINEATDPPSLAPAPAATQPNGEPGFTGLLPDCGKKSNQVDPASNPCVLSRSGVSNNLGPGTLTITISIPAKPGDMTSRG